MGIAVGDDAHNLRVVAGFIGNILDAFALSHTLGYPRCIGIDAIGRDFLHRTAGGGVIKIGVALGSGNAVHAEIG
ncbi:hypothetical protein SDC9_158902 [bioreactor metagenome]|uniref:Uncharacterized protein n=1 Tax=bioreactor metagenome TaxID=1076179 RepID=A0A645FE20_9ZZZZ